MNTMKRKIKNILKTPNQISRDEKLIIDIKNPLNGINKLDTTEKKLSALEDTETAKNETHTKKDRTKMNRASVIYTLTPTGLIHV